MKEFVEYLVSQIVNKPEEVKVEESLEEESNIYIFRVTVSPEDMGLIIGKEGRTIKSLRSLVRAKAIKDGVRVNVELVEPENGGRRVEPEQPVEEVEEEAQPTE